MSEQATPPQPGAGAPAGAAPGAPAATAAPKPKDTPLWMLALVVVLALGAGGALGGLLVAPPLVKAKRAAAAAAHDPKAKKKKKDAQARKGGEHGGKTSSYKLENIVVNPADSQGQRFLMCSLAIEADDDKALEHLREREVELRDRVVSTLTSLTLDQLTASGARDTLRHRLVETIRPLLGEDGADVELKVFLPSFVIQ